VWDSIPFNSIQFFFSLMVFDEDFENWVGNSGGFWFDSSMVGCTFE